MSEDSSFALLMNRLRAGDEPAASEIFHLYGRRLIALAGQRLNATIRQKVDPEDVLQSVFRSFFRRHAEGTLEVSDWNSLWALLTVITLRKCGHQIEHFTAARRDVQRETQPHSDDSSATWQGIARDPTPSEAAMLAEMVEQLVEGLDERDRDIVELTLQGASIGEISDQIRWSQRTVSRVLDRVRRRLERIRAGEEDF